MALDSAMGVVRQIAQVVAYTTSHRDTACGTVHWPNWLRILRLMTWTEGQQVSWGAVAWGTLSGPAIGYEDTTDGVLLMSQQGRLVTTQSIRASARSRDGGPRWELISSLTMWFV